VPIHFELLHQKTANFNRQKAPLNFTKCYIFFDHFKQAFSQEYSTNKCLVLCVDFHKNLKKKILDKQSATPYCNMAIDYKKQSRISEHLSSKGHQDKKNAMINQRMLPLDLGPNGIDLIILDYIRMISKTNMPFEMADIIHDEFLKKYLPKFGMIPKTTTLPN